MQLDSEYHYKTICNFSEGIYKDKGSKFIAYAYNISCEEDVKPLLMQLKKNHPTARHHCYAWRLGLNKDNYRVNDDGEPSGSAGRPILNVILSNELTNIVVFVVRYFGGTLLGVPGLINAYKQATLDALQNSQTIIKIDEDVFNIQFEYIQMNEIMKIIKEYPINIISQHFDNNCYMKISIPRNYTELVKCKINNWIK